MEIIFANSKKHNHILANSYFQLANLYVEFDELDKAIELYNQCISLTATAFYDGVVNDNNSNIQIYSYYNLGLIYYVTDQYSLSKKMLEIALELNRSKNNDIDNETSAIISETLGEVELDYKKFGEALIYLSKALDIRKRLIQSEDKFSIKRIAFFINFIYDQYNYEELNINRNNNATGKQMNQESNLHNDRHKHKISSLGILGLHGQNSANTASNITVKSPMINSSNINSNSFYGANNQYTGYTNTNPSNTNYENFNNISNNNNYTNKRNEADSDEENNFNYNFTNFMKSNINNLNQMYSNIGLKVKNKEIDKPEAFMMNPDFPQTLRDDEIEEIEKFFLFITQLSEKEIEVLNQEQKFTDINLPINLSENFKSCLSYSQKIQILELKVLKLRRNLILKNPRNRIEIDNLNFEILQKKNNSKKSFENIINRYANNYNIEKWAENNINIINENIKKNTLKHNQNNNSIGANGNKNNNNNISNHPYSNAQGDSANKVDDIQINRNNSVFPLNNLYYDETENFYDLNQRELLMFNELKNSIVNYIEEHPEKSSFVPSDEEIAEFIKNFNEDQIKYSIKNPELIIRYKFEDETDNQADNIYESQ